MARVATTGRTQEGLGELLRAAGIAALLSLVVNHVIRIAAMLLLSPDPGFLPLTSWGPVTIFTLIGVAGATIFYAVLRRFAADPGRVFTIVASVLLVLSFIPNILTGLDPASAPVPGVTWPGVIALMLMHIPPAYFSVRFLAGK
jgi:hypothetical protein